MTPAAFASLHARARTAATVMAGEEVTIGAWTGQAIVNGGAAYLGNVVGGVYQQDVVQISVTKEDLGVFVPVPQMDVLARGKELRIPDEGITEYADRYVITAAGREVPSR